MKSLRDPRIFDPKDVIVEVTNADQDVMLVELRTSVGTVSILGSVTLEGRVLHIRRAHIDGLSPGALGRRGLNAIGRKLLDEADADQVVIEGGTRTTGLFKGRRPRIIRFPRPPDSPGGD